MNDSKRRFHPSEGWMAGGFAVGHLSAASCDQRSESASPDSRSALAHVTCPGTTVAQEHVLLARVGVVTRATPIS